jgi:hypothetical protein
MEFINVSLIKLELELNLNKNNTVFHFASEAEAETKSIIPPLVHLHESRGWITQEKFIRRPIGHNKHPLNGPTFESNLLIPKEHGSSFGCFGVGAYPETYNGYLNKILNFGFNTFVCLNNEYGLRIKANYFEPYAKNNPRIPASNFIHKKIKDMGVGSDEDIIEIGRIVVERLKKGENVYLHCAGGHGRTGGYAAYILHLLYPELSSAEIFEYIQFAHDQRDGHCCGDGLWIGKMLADPWSHHFQKGQVPSPQTIAQRDQFRRLIGEKVYGTV